MDERTPRVSVFLSFTSQGRVYARALAALLSSADMEAWFDEIVQPGESVEAALRHALRSTSLVVVFVTPDASTSRWLNFEVGVATGRDVPVLPVLLDGVDATFAASGVLGQYQALDARNLSAPLAAARIVEAVQHMGFGPK